MKAKFYFFIIALVTIFALGDSAISAGISRQTEEATSMRFNKLRAVTNDLLKARRDGDKAAIERLTAERSTVRDQIRKSHNRK